MLPNFLIVGSQKAATTWLATCLGEHPEVFIPAAKEIYFFNVHYDKGLPWYRSHFGGWSGQTVVGEATPGYISHPAAPQRIRATLGEVKLIASLRHPVDRAYSAYWHYVRSGRISPGTDFVTLFHTDERFELRRRGYYFAQLRRFVDHFSRERLLVLIFEEIFQDSRQTITDCLNFLKIDPHFEPRALSARVNRGRRDISRFHALVRPWHHRLRELRDMHLLPSAMQGWLSAVGHRVFEKLAFELGPTEKRFEKLDEDLRQELFEGFRADVQSLEELLERDLSIWHQPAPR